MKENIERFMKENMERLKISLKGKTIPFIYDYRKMWFKLTGILLISIYFVVKGCTYPLWLDNALIRILFYSPEHGDKTFYNIAISVIAAYIFYIVQVYIPEKNSMKKRMTYLSGYNQHEIFLLTEFITSWDIFLSYDNGHYWCTYTTFEFELHEKNSISHTVDEEEYAKMISELIEYLKIIKESNAFCECDSSYIKLINDLYNELEMFILKSSYKKIVSVWSTESKQLEKRQYHAIRNTLEVLSEMSYKLQFIEGFSCEVAESHLLTKED